MDLTLSLALAIHSRRNGYALLLGSGISRSSGIPTGWEIVLDLIARMAVASGKNAGSDPVRWYREEYGEDPRYDSLLDGLLCSPQDRQALLRTYFEPTVDEREQGIKTPSLAHKAIAQLVAGGFVRMILTTNFDRLLEQALDEVNIRPIVIDGADSILGAPSIPTNEVFVIKVHGDYMDTRIRNTPEELSCYEPEMEQLLERVFSDFGLVVCGWSGDWDPALREVLRRGHREPGTTYWTSRGDPRGEAAGLAEALGATIINIRDADTFFQDLMERVTALQSMTRGAPLSDAAAIATIKRYLPDPAHRIRLRDLVLEDVQRLLDATERSEFPVTPAPSAQEVLDRMKQLEELTGRVSTVFSIGCFYGLGSYDLLWVEGLELIGRERGVPSGGTAWLALERYPALLILYAAGISCVASGEFGSLRALLTTAMLNERGDKRPAVMVLNSWFGDGIHWDVLPGFERHYTPLSDILADSVRPFLREVLPDDEKYEDMFDRYEYIAALTYADIKQRQGNGLRGPVGRFGWRKRRLGGQTQMAAVGAELTDQQADWPPIKAGFFQGSLERAVEVKGSFDQWLTAATPGWDW